MTLLEDFNYPASRMEIEYGVSFGREVKRADIVVFDKDNPNVPYIIVELKKPKLKEGKEQLKSYCNATGAPIGIWTNGESISYYHRKDPNFFEDLSAIPHANQKLSDILQERWNIDDLIKKDKLITERKSLKDLILEMEDEVLANAGVDVFEELFKLIFTKLYDESQSGIYKERYLEFRNYGDTETELKNKIQNLFDRAKKKWDGVFKNDDKIALTPSHLSICIASLQDIKLFNSNLEVVDEAFEYLINKSSKGDKGQYFTPRYVIDMCVKMLNPQKHETMIDTAAGSCGFPVHTIFYVWEQIFKEKGLNKSHLFTLENKPPECTDYVNDKVFAIDFDERAVRVARTLNLIAGDGQTNVLHLNTLDYERWEENTKDENWTDTYHIGWKKLK
jgi:type I restriction enzyme M protein